MIFKPDKELQENIIIQGAVSQRIPIFIGIVEDDRYLVTLRHVRSNTDLCNGRL